MKSSWITIFIILFLLAFRIFLGLQINFNHEDYDQVYLIGLKNAFSGNWSYWGPDVVWSQTRLPGALQGLLVGIPLRIVSHPFSPIIFSNSITVVALFLLSWYARKRFPKLPFHFLLIYFLILPFTVFQGVVMLNTTYLLLSGALLFIAVFELFVYRDKLLLKNPAYYFLIIGFSLLITFQLHLTWVMFLPFIVVLVYLEWRREPEKWWKPILFLFLGSLISGSTFLPTLIKYPEAIFMNTGGNMAINFKGIFSLFDVIVRLFAFSTFDITPTYNFSVLAADKNKFIEILFWIMKGVAILHFLALCVSFYFVRKGKEFRKTMLLFLLSVLMATFLFCLSNKHLESRTYILLYPIPVWLSLFSYQHFYQNKYVRLTLHVVMLLTLILFSGIAIGNYKGAYSFDAYQECLEPVFEHNDPDQFGPRRYSLMDEYK